MNVNNHSSFKLAHWLILLTAVLMGISTWDTQQSGVFTDSIIWQVVGYVWVVLTFIAILLAVLSLAGYLSKILLILSKLTNGLGNLKWLNLLFFASAMVVYPWLVFGEQSQYFSSFFFRAAMLWLLSGLAALALKSFVPSLRFVYCFLLTFILTAALYQSASYLRDISTYSLSNGWSEGSRFYYASLPFAKSIYGKSLPLSFLHPSRYLLMSLPFLVKGLPLWIHRAWQVFLWLSMTALGAYCLAKRLKLVDWWKTIALTAWGILFFFQGPVYYHLLVCVIIILWGYKNERYKQNLITVIIASLWAGISRVNWFPLPGALAALLYILETPYDKSSSFWNYFRKPIVFLVGGLSASLVAQAAYIAFSGNQDLAAFSTSFTSDLLWYRLLPSSTNSTGILTGILLLCSPLIILIITYFIKMHNQLHLLRKIAIIAIVLVFFLGGLVVSVKIGGGSNLHNLDAFMILLTCVGAYFFFGKYSMDILKPKKTMYLPGILLLLIILIPTGWSLTSWQPFPILDKTAAYYDVLRLQDELQNTADHQQEILFISERHLLTFNRIHDVPLVEDYELLTLMEMAMANNQAYLQHFYTDLKTQRFGLIVTNKQYVIFKDASKSFSEENNAWVQHIVVPLMKYYQPITWMRASGLEIYARRNLPSH